MTPSSPATADRILKYTTVAANVLRDVVTASQIPFFSTVWTIALAIVPMVQNARFQRDRCFRILEEIHHSLCALTSLSIYSDGIQAPKMLHQIAQYVNTLQKFHSCLRSQQELGTLKRLFKRGEIIAQLDICEKELKASLATFIGKKRVGLATAVVEFDIDTEMRHQELLEIISSQSSLYDTRSSTGQSSLNASSVSFSSLPATPKIFHGREAELENLVNILIVQPARIAILGPGGMGKTTLAIAALHDARVAERYSTCYFISCDSAHTSNSLVAIIASSLGLEASGGFSGAVIRHLSAGPSCLLILDNFETPWEPMDGRAKVEEFLSLLTDVQHVTLLITMRGAERPGKVRWTRPFLRPLTPLAQTAARQTFIDIADDFHNDSEVDRLLGITENVPLAIQLVASIAASEGCEITLERWNFERTTLLSAGCDKRSNLEISITLSLSSPRMLSSPHAAELLSLMSLLSDGISDLDLAQSNIPIPDIPNCKTTLVRTSLAYIDHAGRFKVLAPIREYIHLTKPPSIQLVQPMRKYLIDLLKLYMAWSDTSSFAIDLVPRLVSNLGNLHSVLLQGLDTDHSELRESILGIIMLNHLNVRMNRGLTPLMLRLPEILSRMDDHYLHGQFITGAFEARRFYTLPNLEVAIDEGIKHFQLLQERNEEGAYYFNRSRDFEKAEHFYLRALSVASQCSSATAKVKPLAGLGTLEWSYGNYSKGLQLAKETYRISRLSGNVWGELNGVRLQALCYALLGNFKQSLELLDEGKGLIVRAGVQGGEMESILMNIEANVYQDKTEYSTARHIQEAILHQTSAVLSPISHAFALVSIATLDIVTGTSADIVARNLDAGRTSFRIAQDARGIMLCDCNHADLRLREGDTIWARVEYIRLFFATWGRDNELARYCVAKLADPIEPMHSEMESARWAVVFLAFALLPVVRSPLMVHGALRRLGDVLARQGADDAALSLLNLALEGFTSMDVHQSRAECMRTIGDVYMRHGDLSKARETWEAARPLFERSEQKKEVARIDERLQTLSTAKKLEDLPKTELPVPQIPLHDSDMEGEEQKPHLIPDM
ncbi:NB-ARC domain-containing protein [Mycena venus]|uniref:NB-ARC domain-containing protein n=1 Tax=Mycena venus TaxID=2733690 RepID=A0A8H6XMX9_9AGAR|nr:NB-ARC domain-containing protein [Mycena venus]